MILVLNLGSSSLKFKVYDQQVNKCLCAGLYEKIGFKISKLNLSIDGQTLEYGMYLPNHRSAICSMKKVLINEQIGVLNDFEEITSIGHRVVHGGEYFSAPALITEYVIERIKELETLAPIHNAINLEGILDCMIEFPNIPQVAVFDTSFFYDLPEETRRYPLPRYISERYKIRKYGFHGISHEYVYDRYVEKFGNKDAKIISCHLGNGSSVCAIKDGTPWDISMGFTPLDGLMMGTRSGACDPAIATYLISRCGLRSREVENILNKESGLLGISEFSSDIRDLMKQKDPNCKLAIDMYCHSIVKYIGSYFVSLGGLDALIFTGGIGENIPKIREKICKDLKCLGISIDASLNNSPIDNSTISDINSKSDVLVIKSDEELSIAKQTYHITQF